MKPRRLSVARLTFPLAAALAALHSVSPVSADTFYFDGGGTITTGLGWGTNTIWSTDLAGTTNPVGAPGSADDVIFSITGASAGVVGMNAARAANSLTFSSSVANTLMAHTTTTTANTLTIGAGGVTIDSGAGAVTFGESTRGILTTILGASQSWTHDGSNSFSVIQPVTLGSNTLTLDGSGTGGTTISGAISGAGGLIVNRSGSGLVTLSGASNFTGGVKMTQGTASFTSTGLGTGKITFDGNSTLRWGTSTTTDLSSRLIIQNGVIATLDTGANNVTFASIFGLETNSKGTLNKTGTGTLTLGNTVNQFAGNTVITNGKVALGGQYSLWQSAYDTTGSTGAIGLTVTGQANPWLGGLAGSVNLATAITGYGSVASLNLNPQSGSSVSYGGVIANGAAGMTLNKTGHGTQTLTGTNTYSGATTVWAGTLALSGASGSALNSAFTVRGGTLELDNSGGTFIDRLTNGTALSLGSLNLKSYNGAGAQTETVGATTFAVGGKVTITNGTTVGDQITLAMGAVTRSVGAAINFVGVNGTLGGGANSPNVTSTGAFPNIQNNILPWATVGGTQWAENNAGSIRAYSGTFTTLALATNTTQAQQTGAATLAGALNTNSLNVISDGSSNILALGGNTISFGNTNVAGTLGAILKSGTNAYTISGGTIRVGTGGAGTELITHVDGGALTISANLNTAIVNLAKGGTGDLILSGTRAGTMSGSISIAGGQLEFQGNSTTLSGVITGAGGLTINLNAGQTLTMGNNSNSYAGPTIVKGGYLAFPAYNSIGLPGGLGQTPGTNTSLIMSNLILQGGVFNSSYIFNKDLGAGPGQVQILAGTSGFVNTASSGGAAGFTLDGGREIVWGSTYFNPTVFVHSLNSNNNLTLNLGNGFDLNGSTRTVLVGDATYNSTVGVSQLGGNIRNSSGTAGLTKIGIGTLLLSGTNTYNGATTISSGILRFSNQVSLYNNTPASWTAANIVVANTGTLALNVGGAGQFTTGNVTTLLTNLGGANGTSTTGFAAGSSIGFDTTNAAGSTFTVADNIADSSGTGGGAIGVVKLGSNTLVLSGTSNSYSGATVIRGGTLSLTGSLTGNTAISTADNNNGGGGTVLNGILNQSAAGVISGTTASFTQGSSGTSILAGNNSYGGGTTLNAGTLTVAHANALGTGTGTIALNGGTIQSNDATARSFTNAVTIGNFTVGGTGNLTFSNTGTSALGGSRTITVTNSGTTATFAQAFTGTGNSITKAGAGTLVLSGNNSGVTGGTILTGGTLILAGSTALPAGAITFGTTNTTLRFENDSNLSVTNALTTSNRSLNRTLVVDRLTSGAAVNLSFSSIPNLDCGNVINFQAGSDITSGTPTITFSNGITSSDSNNGTIAGGTGANGAIRFNPTGVNVVINGINSSGRTRGYILDGTSTGNRITGTWANGSGTEVLKDGTGTWTLAGISQYTLTTTINNGTLQFEKQTALYNNTPASWTAANLIVKNGGTLAFNVGGTGEFTTGNVTTLLTNLAASSSATNGMNAGSRFGFDTTNASGGTFTIADVIADSTGASGGARGLTKLGTGILILSVTNTYTGTTLISAGTLELGGTTGSLSGTTAITNNSNLTINRSNAFTQATDLGAGVAITGSVTFTQAGAGTTTLTNAANSFSGKTIVRNGTLSFSAGDVSATADQQLGKNSDLDLGVAATSSGRLLYTGGTGTLAKNVNALGNGNNIIENDGGGILTLSGTLAKNGTVLVLKSTNSGSGFIVNNAITGASANSDLVVDGGTVTMVTANTYDGPTSIINAGTLKVSSLANGGIASGVGLSSSAAGNLVFDNGTLEYTGAVASTDRDFTIKAGGATIHNSGTGALTWAGDVAYDVVNQARTLNLSGTNTGGFNTFSGSLTNNGSAALTVNNDGSWILSGTNTYTGDTTVSGGTLAVNGTITSDIIVQSGATLQGSGSTTGSVTVQGGGTMATGNSIESFAEGTLTLNASSTFAYEVDRSAAASVAGDLTAVTGNLNLDLANDAILTITDLGGSGTWDIGEELTLISYSGTWNGGLFTYLGNDLTDDSTFFFNGANWLFNYNDTTAGTNFTGDLTTPNFVTMTVIPETSTALLSGLGALALLRRRRSAK